MAAYSATKAALTAYDAAAGRELRRAGIRLVDARPPPHRDRPRRPAPRRRRPAPPPGPARPTRSPPASISCGARRREGPAQQRLRLSTLAPRSLTRSPFERYLLMHERPSPASPPSTTPARCGPSPTRSGSTSSRPSPSTARSPRPPPPTSSARARPTAPGTCGSWPSTASSRRTRAPTGGSAPGGAPAKACRGRTPTGIPASAAAARSLTEVFVDREFRRAKEAMAAPEPAGWVERRHRHADHRLADSRRAS